MAALKNGKSILCCALIAVASIACARSESPAPAPAAPAPAVAAPPAFGDAARGKLLAGQYGCNVCHITPGLDGPQGSLGPSLKGVASRPRISEGVVENTPENLAKYIESPRSMNPDSTMPPLGLATADTRDIAAFLMTLK